MVNIIQPSDSDGPLGPAGLGNVPTIGGNVSTAIPPAPGVPSAVQDQQSAGTATQAAAQSIVLPPIPYAVIQRLDPSGSFTMWLQTLVRKLGGYASTPTTDAELLSDWGDVNTSGQITALVHDLSILDQPQAPVPVPVRVEDLWDDGDDTKGWVKAQRYLTEIVGYVPTSRAINTTAPLTGGGSLAGDLTLAMPAATGAADGYLSASAQTVGGAKTFAALSTFQAGINLGNENLTVYDEGTWTPTPTNLGGSSISYDASYTRIGNRVDFTIIITGTGLTATANSTRLSLPLTPSKNSACGATNSNAVANYGTGLIYAPSATVWLPTISSTTDIVVSGTFFV